MPRGFSDHQMQAIKGKLISSAIDALKNAGIRKTTVEELVKTVQISTGAFYKFYPSKEALFFEVYDITEEKLKTEFAIMLQNFTKGTVSEITLAIKQLFRSDNMQTLLQLMRKDELEYMLRNIDPVLVEKHLQKDQEYLQGLIDQFQEKGFQLKIDANDLLSYLQALFVLNYEKEKFAQHADQIIDAFINTMVHEAIA